MGLGASLFLIAGGAILVWGVNATVAGLDVNAIGVILMVIGIIGLVLSAIMFIFLVVVNAYSLITGLTCLICLVFLFFESAFGICLGCKFYPLFFKEKAQFCPGEICAAHERQEIQKTSFFQWLVALGMIIFIWLFTSFSNGYYSRPPHYLFDNQVAHASK